tara:strand:+ start:96 stop:620 length:525 start_codon:yes stop_codon:yes gene_type:complete
MMSIKILIVLVFSILLLPFSLNAKHLEIERHGPYLVKIEISPEPPTIRGVLIAVTLKDAITGASLDDAAISILTKNVDDETIGETPARSNSAFPGYYRVAISPEPGTWDLQVSIESSLGKVLIPQKQIVIPEFETPFAGTLMYSLVVIAIVGVSSYLWWTSRKIRQSRRLGSPD